MSKKIAARGVEATDLMWGTPANIGGTNDQLVLALTTGLLLVNDKADYFQPWDSVKTWQLYDSGILRITFSSGVSENIWPISTDAGRQLDAILVGKCGERITAERAAEAARVRLLNIPDAVLLSGQGYTAAKPGLESRLTVVDDDVELWTRSKPETLLVCIPRADVLNVEVGGGASRATGGGFIGGGFGIDGAVIGILAASVLNSLTTSTKTEPSVLHISTAIGHLVIATTTRTALELAGAVAPLKTDAIRNSARLSALPEVQGSAQPAEPDPIDQIARLGELHSLGILTDAEYEQKKEQLLRRI